ncbi:response regulator [Lactonifactor sp. BIOML-A3]|uniref:winged helix-turn-helix domain-containing protein n=1 Tax=unclassified Lactonifactor TaxID=2636670 RepID=UPI0012B02C5B|nr:MULTISPECIES: winged helix-turn-helix domain-containing protein [unclassified Lactonifactor]MSA01438.1 response regulator [Lactonifactor sp. BIOML-A5]MSA08080.1 response regulator [Lactonifactor sp. BIOML-A4]MSA12345.1 response regulator [Lactonifactor sp. BIOML-A3]MSA17088.1 response regulator [Lactonifactor sp. BIOML-A2]MSA37699.1 response regulator [Lactonifactor sp. BIOML-A1]
MKNRILVVEDEKAISDLICMNLEVAGYEALPVYEGDAAEQVLWNEKDLDLAPVDIMLPGRNGFELMECFQKRAIPVIYLTAMSDVASKVKGLREGAEDYIVKPFEVLELLVRIEKVLERTGRQKEVLSFGGIVINLDSHQVRKDGECVTLKPMEYDLLLLLVKNKNVAFTREQLLQQVWGSGYMGETRTVDVHVGQLRKKLGLTDQIKTIPKLGYRLEDRE